MTKLVILIGISGSGKTTYAHNEWKKDPLNTIIYSRDKVRELLFGYSEETIHEYYGRQDFYKLEKKVTTFIDDSLIDNQISGLTIILDNTHLRSGYITPYLQLGLETEFIWLHTPLEECIERDSKRIRKVGEDIIRKQYSQFKELEKFYLENGGFS